MMPLLISVLLLLDKEKTMLHSLYQIMFLTKCRSTLIVKYIYNKDIIMVKLKQLISSLKYSYFATFFFYLMSDIYIKIQLI